MKVILLKDVAKIGRKNSVVEVPTGYAQNQLIPKGSAAPATPANLKAIKNIQAEKEAAAATAEEKFFAAKKKLEDQPIIIDGLKSDNGHLFAAVKVEKIVEAAKNQGVDIEPSMISINSPIKSVGEHKGSLVQGKHEAEIVVKIT
ncbi:MAG: 50S ribosomal protein L9 [Candidatus Paceibacterota bacterium]